MDKQVSLFKFLVLFAIVFMVLISSLNQLCPQVSNIIQLKIIKTPIVNFIKTPTHNTQSIPIILYWSDIFSKHFTYFIPKNTTTVKCPYKCLHVKNREKYGKIANVRVFHQRVFNPNFIPPNNHLAFNVKFNIEPPYLSYSRFGEIGMPVDYFNATISYRSNSEIYYPYDFFIKRDGNETVDKIFTDQQVEQKLAGKRKGALIAMSNCMAHSKRHEFVNELGKFIEITRIGNCNGTIKCSKDSGKKIRRQDIDCMQRLNDEHFFYLAFENSVCPEYTTEKFWRLKQLIVPVVLSRSAMDPHIPNDTYIAASDFESPKALADRLHFLMNNKEEYRKYFAWTHQYRKTRITDQEINASCRLCEFAYQNKPKRIKNYKEAWSDKECILDYALDLINNPSNVARHEKKLAEIMAKTNKKRSIDRIL